jgi:DNA-binding MarR family transcriptional regulator
MGTNGNGKKYERNDALFMTLEIPIGMLAIPELSLEEKLVLACLYQNYESEIEASPISIRATANFLSFNPKKVSDAMFELEKKGLISKEINGFVFYDHPCYHMIYQKESNL